MVQLSQEEQTHSILTGWISEPLMTKRKTAYSMIEHQDDSCLKAIVDQLIAPMFPNKKYWTDTYYWECSSVHKDMILSVFGDFDSQKTGQSAPRLGHFSFSREGLAEALKACGYKNPEEWG